jgi:hypothetical protein
VCASLSTRGCGIASDDASGIAAAAQLAAGADAAVLMVGLTQVQESEGHDRTDIDLPGVQHQLIAQVCGVGVGAGGGACVHALSRMHADGGGGTVPLG